MKRIILLACLVTTAFLLAGTLFAQDARQVVPLRRTLVDALQEDFPGKGMVVIDQPPAIRALIGGRRDGQNIETTADGQTFLKHQGFRIQIFSGNNQRTAKDEAFRKEKEINERFPTLATYVTYEAPFWRLRVGNYDSQEEAFHNQRQLSEAFPAFAREIYIVREEIKVPIFY
jgi:hypothetical protein